MIFSTPWLINQTVTDGKGAAGRARGMDGGGAGRVGTPVIAPLFNFCDRGAGGGRIN